MNIINKSSSCGFITALIFSLFTGNAAADLNLAQSPLSLADQVASNVMVMLDNSGSMTDKMYKADFDSTVSYGGMFTDGETYEYDPEIPVNAAAYPYMLDDATPTPATVIDTDAKGAFVEKTCTPGAGANCWSGNFLNWLTTRRIDASRDVLVGGKLESRTPSNYNHPSRTDLNNTFKKVANNEPSDRDETDSSDESFSHSPIPNDLVVTITSPAKGGAFKSKYDPYAKLNTARNPSIYNKAGDVIGEFNTVTVTKDYSPIKFNKTYTNPPIVIATAPSSSDSVSIAIRIRDVTTSQFRIKLRNWQKVNKVNNPDGLSHGDETISFIVLESGEHILPGVSGDLLVKADTVTNVTEEYVISGCTTRTNNKNISFTSTFPVTSTPIVISSSMTENGGNPITTRVWDIDSSGFKLALQEEEFNSTHAPETVGYIAIQPGTVNDTTNGFKLEAELKSNVDNTTDSITYASTFESTPAFVAAIQTMNEADTAALRLDSNSKTTASLYVDEELSCDSETTHANENVGYIALEGPATSYNLALVVKGDLTTGAAPTGVLHDVYDDVRMGISFYRYDPDATDIYEDSRIQGGTLRFNIPKNPFVKKPSETDTAKLPSTQHGYRVLEGYIGTTSIETIVDTVERYPSIWGTTPIAENLWEVIQYFEQDSPYYDAEDPLPTPFADFVPAKGTPADPFFIPAYNRKLSCVNSSVLIVTDGEPYRDAGIPSALVDYDGDSAADELSDLADDDARGHDNLDDVAYWAFCDTTGGTNCKTGGKATTKDGSGNTRTNLRDLRTDTGMDGAQYLRIDTIGFAGGSVRPVLRDTADNAAGTAYAAAAGAELKAALTAAFANAAKTTSTSAIAANSTVLNADSAIYQGSFNSGNWSGQLRALDLNPVDANVIISPIKWHTDSATTFAAHGTRKVFTHDGSAGVAFQTLTNLNATQQTQITQNQIDYLRGDSSMEYNESTNPTGPFRERTLITNNPITGAAYGTPHKKILGDIANSSPWVVAKENFGYFASSSGLTSDEKSKYRAFQYGKSSRSDTVYVGANDGMLHAFDALTGIEKFAYVPSTVIPELKNLTDPSYGEAIAHQYFVDGSPKAGDVYYSGDWHTVLVGTLGAGGRGIFALNVDNPDAFGASNVLWEFNPDNTSYTAGQRDNLGYTMSEPSIVRLANGKWGVVVGNGYNSVSHKAVLFILDIADGSVIAEIDTGVGSSGTPNGLSSPVVIDTNGDRIADTVYAGDLRGNMWKFDINDATPGNWGTAFIVPEVTAPPASAAPAMPLPLFVATDGASIQPITAKPLVGRHPDGGVLVYFGTGKFFEIGDNIVGGSPQVQTYYGLRDNFSNGDATPITARSELKEQTIDTELSQAFDTNGDGSIDGSDDTLDLRITSENPVNYTDTSDPGGNPIRKGWFMDLESPTNGAEGERVIYPSILNGSQILFSTLIPDGDPCSFGGTGWFMVLDGATGARATQTTFDLNNDGDFDDTDNATVAGASTVVSGKRTSGPLGGVVSSGDTLHVKNSDGDGTGEPNPINTGVRRDDPLGRQSWRQLR